MTVRTATADLLEHAAFGLALYARDVTHRGPHYGRTIHTWTAMGLPARAARDMLIRFLDTAILVPGRCPFCDPVGPLEDVPIPGSLAAESWELHRAIHHLNRTVANETARALNHIAPKVNP